MSRQKANREQHYQFLVNIMREGKVDTLDKAQVHMRGMRQKATRFSVVALGLAMLLYLIMPKLLAIWFMLAFGAIAWAWASTLTTINMMKTYIKRELSEPKSPDSSTSLD